MLKECKETSSIKKGCEDAQDDKKYFGKAVSPDKDTACVRYYPRGVSKPASSGP